MKKVGIVDVKTRLRNIPEGAPNYTRSETFREQAEKAIASGFPSSIIFCIESGIGDPSASMPEDSIFDLLEALADVGTASQVEKYGRLIMKEYTSKTRDAKETLRYIKQRLGRAKGKITTKIQNNFDDLWQATNSTIGTAKDNFNKNTEPYKNAIANAKTRAKQAGHSMKKAMSKNEEALLSTYEAIEEAASCYVTVDRILENYDRVSKRFNIDRIIKENTVANGVSDTCVEVCNLIETYDMPVKARYNTCLETIWYGLHKNGFTFNEQEMVTTVTDFYMAKGGNSFACKSILEASVVFDKGDYMGDIDVITEEEPEDDSVIEESDNPIKDLFKRYGIKACLDEIRPKVKELIADSPYKKRIKVITGYKEDANEKTVKWYICDYAENWNYANNSDLIELFDKIADMVKSYINKHKSEFELGYEKDDDDFIVVYIKVPNESGVIESYIHEIEFKNDEGKEVPKKCPKCGSKVAVFLKGEPVFLCSNKDCNTYFGTVPFKESGLYKYMVEGKLTAKERKNIKDSDYGIPSKRKYPMPDESHVRSAIQMFNHVDSADEAELARNIKKKIKKYGMSVSVGKENRFSKYYKAANETATIMSDIREYATHNSGYPIVEEDETAIDFNKLLNDYKTSNDTGKENKLKSLVLKLYKLPPDQVIEGTPNLLRYIRGILVISGFAINPILGIISFIADQIVAMHMKREESAKMREVFKEEIRKTDKKIESTKSTSQKDNLQKYRDSLTNAYNKIDEYYESLLSDEELDDKYDAADDSDIKAGSTFGDSELDDFEKMFGGDFDFDDDDFDDMDGFEESGKFIVVIDTLLEAYEECKEKSFDQHKCRKMIRMSPSIVGSLADVAKKYPSIISKRDLLSAIDDVRSDVQIGAVRINMIERYDLNNAYDELIRSPGVSTKYGDIFSEARSFATQINVIRALNDIYSSCTYYSPMTEASFTNSLKLAGEKLKKAMTKASDADKTISKNIDVSLSNLSRSVERAMTNDRRDAIIKGSVIPSASKIIKGAILAGAGYIVLGPAIATIGVLGYLGMSKKLNDKQRKVILDEIEIELKMCEKYIDLAESKNDLKALKKLYAMQKELQKQRGKIKYRIGLKGERYTEPEKFDPANQ